MKLRRTILNFILVRESESKLVKNLFIFEFFQGSGIALFFTAAISIFLHHLPTTDLPKVYILSAILLWITGYLYHKLEHALSIKNLITFVVVFNTAIILLFRVLYNYNIELWYLYLFLAAFNVLYLLNNLEFWGLAAQIFDVRQSKRLFGIISAGDIPAKMIGFLSAYLIIPFIGTENLLLVAASLTLVSLLLIDKLFKLIKVESSASVRQKQQLTQSIKNIHAVISGNKLIRKIAIVSFFSFLIFLIVNFVFYGYVKSEFKSDKDLVSFFAIFFGITRLITFALKIGIANKMVDKMGLRNALMLSPILLLLICGIGVYLIQEFEVHRFTFYLFGILTVITDVLRSAIQTPVLLATLQPLPVQQRLKGHTIIKGLMDPFAFLTAGIFLWFFTTSSTLDFAYLNYIIISLILFWAFFTWSVEKDYLNTLHTAIRNRTLTERDISITDKESLSYLLNKLINGNQNEAISVLKLIADQKIDKVNFLISGLEHSSTNVKLATLSIIQNNSESVMLPLLKELLNNSKDTSILPEIITTITSLDKKFKMDEFINHPDINVSFAATLSTIPNFRNKNNERTELILYNHFNNKNIIHKINAIKIVAKFKLNSFDYKLIELMNSENNQVKSAARIASATLGTNEIIIKLIDDLLITKNDLDIIETLENIGTSVLKYIEPILIGNKCHGSKSRKLINLLGKIHSRESKTLLEQLLLNYPENADAIINSLSLIKISSSHTQKEINELVLTNLKKAVQILFYLKQAQQLNPIIAKAIELELDIIRKKCLYWFSCIHSKEVITKVKNGFYLNTKESIANAIEIIQLTVRKDLGELFALIFENSSVNDRCLQLELQHHFQTLSEIVLTKNILFDVNYTYNNWTKACVLYGIKEHKNMLSNEFIIPFSLSKNEVLKNTAKHLLSLENG